MLIALEILSINKILIKLFKDKLLKKYITPILLSSAATLVLIITLLIYTSVDAVVTSSPSTTQLSPLSSSTSNSTTTSIPSLDDLPIGISQKDLQIYFLAKTKQIYGSAFIPLSDQDIVGYGLLWCDAINLGMKSSDVEERINEGAIDNEDAALQRAIVSSAVLYFCPNSDF